MATDQVVKLVVVEFVMQPPREIPVFPFLNLILTFNRGVSFGMFADQLADIPGILGGVKILVVLGLLIWAFLSKTAAEAVSLGLIAGGGGGQHRRSVARRGGDRFHRYVCRKLALAGI